MTDVSEVQDSLESFVQSCNDHAQLGGMIKDWNRVFHIRATDSEEDYTLITKDGKVSVAPGVPAVADLAVSSTSEILSAVFYGEVSPNEPYGDGALRILGPEDDVVRLDFVIAMIWE